MKISKYIFIALFMCGFASAAESPRQSKINQIVVAQGLESMFQQQLDQYKASSAEMGRDIFRKILSESGISPSQADSEAEKVFTRYMERVSTLISAKEMTDIWSSHYGKNLTETELDQILFYYNSEAGKKDVSAQKTAMAAFSQVISVEMQKRINISIAQLISDFKSITPKK